MKIKIIISSLTIALICSIIMNVNEFIDSKNLSKQLFQLDIDHNKEVAEIREEFSKEKDELISEYWKLEDKLKQQKEKTLNISSNAKNSEGIEYRAVERILIRSHQTGGSAVLGEVPVGGIVEVLDSFFEDTWKIRYNGLIGWVRTDNRSKVDQIADEMSGKPDRKTLERIR